MIVYEITSQWKFVLETFVKKWIVHEMIICTQKKIIILDDRPEENPLYDNRTKENLL